MNPEEQNFEALKKLLALKRHENPPPGYFENFSSKVIARIEAAEANQSVSLWQRIIGYVEARPARVSTFALAGAAVVAVMLSLAPNNQAPSAGIIENHATLAGGVTPASSISEGTPTAFAKPDDLTTSPKVTLRPASLAAEVDVPGGSSLMNPDAAPAGIFNLGGRFDSFPNRAFSTGSVPQRVSLQLEGR